MAHPTLYGPAFSTYVRSARIALAEKGVEYTLKEFNWLTDGWPEGYERRHPFRKVPAFEHDGFALYEAPAILRYVDEAFEGPALQPREAMWRARMTQAISIVDSYTYGPIIGTIVIQRVIVPMQGGNPDEAAIAAAVPAARTAIAVFDGFLSETPWLAGQEFTLADAHLAPVIDYFRQVPEGESVLAEHAHLTRWWERASVRGSVESTTPSLG